MSVAQGSVPGSSVPVPISFPSLPLDETLRSSPLLRLADGEGAPSALSPAGSGPMGDAAQGFHRAPPRAAAGPSARVRPPPRLPPRAGFPPLMVFHPRRPPHPRGPPLQPPPPPGSSPRPRGFPPFVKLPGPVGPMVCGSMCSHRGHAGRPSRRPCGPHAAASWVRRPRAWMALA